MSNVQESRKEYFKKRRETRKHFSVLIDKKKAEELEEELARQNKSKAAWLEEKIDDELKK